MMKKRETEIRERGLSCKCRESRFDFIKVVHWSPAVCRISVLHVLFLLIIPFSFFYFLFTLFWFHLKQVPFAYFSLLKARFVTKRHMTHIYFFSFLFVSNNYLIKFRIMVNYYIVYTLLSSSQLFFSQCLFVSINFISLNTKTFLAIGS